MQKARGVNIPLQKAGVMISFKESGKGGAADGRKKQGTPGCVQRRESQSLRLFRFGQVQSALTQEYKQVVGAEVCVGLA